MKKLLLFYILLFAACSKKQKNDVSQTATPMKYSVSFLPDVAITQYGDTTIMVPIVLKYISGTPEPVKLFLTYKPSWVKGDTATLLAHPGDTLAYVLSGFKLRFHPFDAGSYAINFAASSPSAGIEYYTFDITVAKAPDCAAFLVGEYNVIRKSVQYGNTSWTTTVRSYSESNTVNFYGYILHINCINDSITFSGSDKRGYWFGSGRFTDDTIIFRDYAHIDEPSTEDDTCDYILVRK
jgi:hypothetical protein